MHHTYLVLGEGQVHVVVVAVIEHVDGLLAQLGHAGWPHGNNGWLKACQQEEGEQQE